MVMRSRFFAQSDGHAVAVQNGGGKSDVILICEHASNTLPAAFGTLGLSPDVLESHVAWDPGALAVAQFMSDALDATLVYQRFSRLVYDCNRPPGAPGAMPEKSEIHDIPGNVGLSEDERFARTAEIYIPFHKAVDDLVTERRTAGRNVVIVTVHSFTPVYHGKPRSVEIGILHDADARLADAMLGHAEDTSWNIARNEPYGPEDGVTHTLRLHALRDGLLNVMIEIRNDLIHNGNGQRVAADFLTDLLNGSLAELQS